MKLTFKTAIIPIFVISSLVIVTMLSPSCANTTTPPSGGDKDTIPPSIVNIVPLPYSTNIPVNQKITFTFDEYVQVKEPKNIYLSPPSDKAPKYRLRGKNLIIYFESPLNKNTTYTLDITGAIADNNEGNMFPGYSLVFSTGSKIDSMLITGSVYDCNTLLPCKGATVMLYKDLSDSVIFKKRPDASIKTDDWGFFALRNIEDTEYRLYALSDENNNNMYDPENEMVGFVSETVRPVLHVSDTLKELLKYDMRDTIKCLSRKSEHEIYMFKGKTSKQMIVNKKRTSERSAYITFMSENPEIDSLWIHGIDRKKLIMSFNDRKDSLEIWINDRKKMPDTLHVFVDYKKSDSLNRAVPFVEHLKLPVEKKNKRPGRKNKADTLCNMTVSGDPAYFERDGFKIDFAYPITSFNRDSVRLFETNPKRQERQIEFEFVRDTSNLRIYNVHPRTKLLQGYEYILKISRNAFRDINGHSNDSTYLKASLPSDENLSKLILQMENVKFHYLVELLNEERTKVLRSYKISSDKILEFPYLSAGKYSIRITEDKNNNGRVDTGDLLQKKQPEKVKFYKLKDGLFFISIKENMEITQVIDVQKMFGE